MHPSDSSDLSILGREISAARRARAQTQQQLAQSAGLSRQTLSALEAGTVKDLGIRKVLRVLEQLGLSLVVRPADHPLTLDDLLREQQREGMEEGEA